MLRKRLATLAAVAGLGLSLGCSSTQTACGPTRTGFLSRLCGRCRTPTVVTGAVPVVDTGGAPCCTGSMMSDPCDGPMLMDRGNLGVPGFMPEGNGFVPPFPQGATMPPATGGGVTVPPLQGRLAPQPAQPMPYNP